MIAVDGHAGGETTRQVMRRWALAAACVTVVHGGVALAVAHWPRPESPAGEPAAAVMIELAPMPMAPEVPPQELAVGAQQEVRTEITPVEDEDELAESEELPEPEPLTAEAPPEAMREVSEHAAATELETPDLPEIATAEAVIEAPAARRPEPERAEEKPREPERKSEPKKTQPKRKPQTLTASAPKAVNAARARTNAAPTSGTGAVASTATWRGSVIAHLNRRKRHPGGAARGTATVAFTIDRSGRVLSARLVRSSGSATLDQEAVALARRASPVPAPPANIGRASVTLAVPVRFSR